MLLTCRHLQIRPSTDGQPGGRLAASHAGLSVEVAAIQIAILAVMVRHPQQAVPGVVSAISSADSETCRAARAFLESIVLPLALAQSMQHLNGAVKIDGLPSLLKEDAWPLTNLQQSLRLALKAAYQGVCCLGSPCRIFLSLRVCGLRCMISLQC